MDLYLSLVTGGTLFSLTKDDIANPRELYAKFRESGVTTWVSTPSFAQMCLVERSFGAEMLPDMRRFLFCGEALAHKTAAGLLNRFPAAEVWNTYGPTEATVATTSVRVDAALLAEFDPLPIGRERPGTEVNIRRDDGSKAEDGERGQIIIRGPNVSPGYLARPDLTSAAFFQENGEQAYRTGDKGYAKGEMLFFEGRLDFQVKVRGYRIELGDVESHVRDVEGVVDAVVLPVERRGVVESLAAFVVMREAVTGNEFAASQAIKEALGKKLPDYMLPRKVEFLETFPMTPNGKADRKALAARLA
jgi:D-alanine--poly(phosphoribitol) ligase subunit 1